MYDIFNMQSAGLTKPQNGSVDIKWIFCIAINQAGCVNKCNQAELFLLRRRYLSTEVVNNTYTAIENVAISRNSFVTGSLQLQYLILLVWCINS